MGSGLELKEPPACITLAPVDDPTDLLACLGVKNPGSLDEVAKALWEHADRVWVTAFRPPPERMPPALAALSRKGPQGPREWMPPMLAASRLAGGWSVAVEKSGLRGWEGCARVYLEAMAERYGFVCSGYFDGDDSKIFRAERGRLWAELDVVNGQRRGTVGVAAGERLTHAGFDLPEVPGMPPQMMRRSEVERLNAALTAATG